MRIPAHPDLNVPPSIRANAYEAAEAVGMIWTRLDGLADGKPPSLPAGCEPLASIAIDADPEAIWRGTGAAHADGTHLLSFSHADMVLHAGWHLVHAGKTMLHAVTEAGRAQPKMSSHRARSAMKSRKSGRWIRPEIA